MIKDAHEDKDICAKCGGMCCKKSGCDYSAEDFNSTKFNYLLDLLKTKNISIVSFADFCTLNNGQLVNRPFLYIRARNQGRGPVDLFSFKTVCSNLTDTGCSLSSEDRPSGGKNLIPSKDHACEPAVNPFEIVSTWKPHQDTLRKLVKTLTGKSVEKIWQEDAEELFVKVLQEDFRGVSPIELKDIAGMLPCLYRVYPDAYERARARVSRMPFSINMPDKKR